MSGYCLTKTISILASPEAVFDALTHSNSIPEYYPLKSVQSDWQEGSEVLYRGEIDGAEFTDFGTIDIIDRPFHYRYSYWSDNHGTERRPENYISISYQMVSQVESTELTLTQENIPDKALFKLMNETVWDTLLQSLKHYVESNHTRHHS